MGEYESGWVTKIPVCHINTNLWSRRFPVKVIYMKVVGEGRCNDEIFFKHLSSTKIFTKCFFDQHFSDNYNTIYMIKTGDWRCLFPTNGIGSIHCEDVLQINGKHNNLKMMQWTICWFLYCSHTDTGNTVKVAKFQEGKLLDDRLYIDQEHLIYFILLELPQKTPTHSNLLVAINYLI